MTVGVFDDVVVFSDANGVAVVDDVVIADVNVHDCVIAKSNVVVIADAN